MKRAWIVLIALAILMVGLQVKSQGATTTVTLNSESIGSGSTGWDTLSWGVTWDWSGSNEVVIYQCTINIDYFSGGSYIGSYSTIVDQDSALYHPGAASNNSSYRHDVIMAFCPGGWFANDTAHYHYSYVSQVYNRMTGHLDASSFTTGQFYNSANW